MGDTPTGKIVATIVPALVMVIAMFMILEQLKIAERSSGSPSPPPWAPSPSASRWPSASAAAASPSACSRTPTARVASTATRSRPTWPQGRERAEHQARQADPTREDAGSSYDQGGYQGTPAPYEEHRRPGGHQPERDLGAYDQGVYGQAGYEAPHQTGTAAPYDTSSVETQQFDPRNQ